MDLISIVAVVAGVAFVISLVAAGRAAWRVHRHNEEPEPGGSIGEQLSRRRSSRERKRR
jgi:hypothetical protein